MFSIHFHPLLSKVSKLEMEWVLEQVQNSQSIVRITISALAFTTATHVSQGCKSWAEFHCGQIGLMLVSLCTIPCVQPISSQFFMSYPCLISPFVWLHCPEGVSAWSSPPSVSEPSFSSNLHTNCLFPFFFSNLSIPILFIFSIPPSSPWSSFLVLLLLCRRDIPPSFPTFRLFSLLLNSVSFHRVLSCSRTRCSRMSSWCWSSHPIRQWRMWRPTRCHISRYLLWSLSPATAYLPWTDGTTLLVSGAQHTWQVICSNIHMCPR